MNIGFTKGVGGLAFEVDPVTPSTLYYALIDVYGFFKSTDEGGSWTECNNGLNTRDLWAIAVASEPIHQIFLGTDSLGVFRSTDNGIAWHSFSEGLPIDQVNVLVVDSTSLSVYAGSLDPGGIYRLPLLSASIADDEVDLHSDSRMEMRVYPNPSNSEFRILYEVPSATTVRLEIVDVLGRVLQYSTIEDQLPGRYEYTIDHSTLPSSGIYFVVGYWNRSARIERIVYLK